MATLTLSYKLISSSPVLGSRFALYDNVIDVTVNGNGVDVYATGGIVIDKTQLGLPQQQIERFSVLEQTNAPTQGPIPNYDPINNKLQFFVISTSGVNVLPTEATVAFTPAAPFTLRCEVRGF
jgi:hypothetical protein